MTRYFSKSLVKKWLKILGGFWAAFPKPENFEEEFVDTISVKFLTENPELSYWK